MFKLYYTTTKGEGETQPKSYNSLGGYRSATLVKNDEFDNFFGELSAYTVANNTENQYIGLILRNEGGNKTNITLHFSRPQTCYSKLYAAAVDLSVDSESKEFMESVPTVNSAPLYATFYEAEGLDNAVSLGDIPANGAIGLWLKREILRDIIIQDRSVVTAVDPTDENRVIPKVFEKSDTIDIVLSYD